MARTKLTARRNLKKDIAKTALGKASERAPHRWRPGTVALREIRRFQKSTDLLIKVAPMQRIISSILRSNHPGMRIQAKALPVLMEAVQAIQVKLFQESQLACIHAKRQMITVADLRYACHHMNLDCPSKEERIRNYKQTHAKLKAAEAAKHKVEAERSAQAEAHPEKLSDAETEDNDYDPDAASNAEDNSESA